MNKKAAFAQAKAAVKVRIVQRVKDMPEARFPESSKTV